jgi:hypothetical protein
MAENGDKQKSSEKQKIKEDGTVAGCYGLKKSIPPNICAECPKHSDLTCDNLKKDDKKWKK